MKAKSVFVGIAVIAVVLLLLSITAVSRVLSASPRDLLQGVVAEPLAAKFLPKRSPLVASFLVNPDRLSLFAQLAAKPNERASIKQELYGLKQQLKQTWLLDYDKDVRPWVGEEVTLAMTATDIDRQPENGLQPGYLLALAAKEPALAKKIVDDFWQRQAIAGADLVFEQYQGVPVIYAKSTVKHPALAGAILGKFVLFANDTKVVRNAINDLQVPDLALANLDIYQSSLKNLTSRRVGLAFVNLSELGSWGEKNEVLPSTFANLPKASLTLGLALDRLGVKAETILTTDPGLTGAPLTANLQPPVTKIVQFVPNESSFLVGRDLGHAWQQIQIVLKPYPSLAKALTGAISSFEQNSGFSLEQDLFTWVRGDYALGLLPNPIPGGSPKWVAIVQNNADVKAAVDRLDEKARSQAKLTVGEISAGDRNLTVWTRLSAVAPTSKGKLLPTATVAGNIVAVRTQTPEYLFIANSVDAIELALKDDLYSIAKSPSFQALSATLPLDYQSYAYLNDPNSLARFTPKFPLLDQLQAFLAGVDSPLRDRIRSVRIASTKPNAGDANIKRGQIFFALK